MVSLDIVRNFFVQRILMPRVFQIDIPGYVIGKFYSIEGQSVFARNLFFTETMFVNLEKRVIQEEGDAGRSKLYSLGKKFGHRFSTINRFPRGYLSSSISIIFRFFETLYAEKIDGSIVNGKKLILKTRGLAVTRKNGGGFITNVGGCAGIWAYLLDDYSVECLIQKVSDSEYDLISAPRDMLQKEGLKFFTCDEKPFYPSDVSYRRYNMPPKALPRGAFSMRKLMETGLFSYKEGELRFAISDTRFVPVEISLLFELERAFAFEVLYGATYDSFKELGQSVEQKMDSFTFIAQMLSAFGFGNVDLMKDGTSVAFNFRGYPWVSTETEKTNYAIISGAILGFLDGNSKNQYEIKSLSSGLSINVFIVTVVVGVKP
ncbi:MAG: hypothetical protein WCX64_04865 [Candidatus Micrarchaeia archaeon]